MTHPTFWATLSLIQFAISPAITQTRHLTFTMILPPQHLHALCCLALTTLHLYLLSLPAVQVQLPRLCMPHTVLMEA
jgi:hypothetical protein